MTRRPSSYVVMLGALGALSATACSDRSTAPVAALRTASNLAADRGGEGGALRFDPLAQSAVCTVSGGDPVNPLLLSTGLTQSIIAREPDYPNAPDMITTNETGPQAGRYLYQPSEGSVGAVSVTDLVTGETKVIAQRADWEEMDPIVWTPWGTLLVGEETGAQAKKDPQYPNAIGGLMYELFLNRRDLTKVDSIVARPALGAKAHEGTRVDARGYVYGISERNPGYIYRFVPDRAGDLSSGQLYALQITSATGDRTGEAKWVPLDRQAVQVDASAAADAVGATGYNRPEDIEIGTSSGTAVQGNDVLFVAVTSPVAPRVDNRVLAIDLREGNGNGDRRGWKSRKAPPATAFVWDYVRPGLNASAEFEWPDNLALDHFGNLYIAEDPGGSFATKKKGDDVWMARPGRGEHAPASGVERVVSLTDCDAEPTGIYFDLRRELLYMHVQHRGGDGVDYTVAVGQAKKE